MTTLQEAVALAEAERGVAVVSTLRADATIQSTVVNTGIISHPESGEPVLAFVSRGKVKQANLRARPQISTTFRHGWRYATVEGRAEIAGPDDPQPWLDSERLRLLLREIFTAAGASHDNWTDYDHTMRTERRAAVLIRPTRIYAIGN
ncbi:TIGR03618 family F420-dependent PPOX class oxidoreductase [Mycobacterium simiae]|uniref:TIGR03618 family F420-dependent PPOX class oxidoreductase n=1 Tax=Mycobacterium simiae TaxID=1784 RepID=UPI00041B5988|nr:TIGR03618 family F420-dependent PPOX class oxidoreductase [Mycobacterium simiae]PLV45733.1 pyridoxamine 5'-phosphate oxidase [Mycobacterium tuberculosis variant microti OV254]BBX43446.1 PPOX class F420-dependent enzyme [Mycobacterium simiae]